jgi:hypothetical protein
MALSLLPLAPAEFYEPGIGRSSRQLEVSPERSRGDDRTAQIVPSWGSNRSIGWAWS